MPLLAIAEEIAVPSILLQVNSLYVVVGSLLLGAVVLVVGLVQLAPGAEAARNSAALIATGSGLLVIGVFLAPLRAVCIRKQSAAQKDGTHQRSVTSIDMLLAQHRYSQSAIRSPASSFAAAEIRKSCFSLPPKRRDSRRIESERIPLYTSLFNYK